jgi:hypothetical protein
MRWLDKAIDRLPTWAKLILAVVVVTGSVDLIRQYGFLGFLLRLIFSP